MVTVIREAHQMAEMHFPLGGLNVSIPFERSPRVQLPPGEWAKFTPLGVNVRGYDARQERLRGGVREGLSRHIPTRVPPHNQGWVVQGLNFVSGVGFPPPGGTVQLSQSGRVVTLVAVSQGKIYAAVAGATTWTPAVNVNASKPPLNFSGTVMSAPNNQKLYFCDGINYVYYDPSTNSVYRWVGTASSGVTQPVGRGMPGSLDDIGLGLNIAPGVGTRVTDVEGNPIGGAPAGVPTPHALPRDPKGNAARLICTWRGRTVLSGILTDGSNWFMSAVSDPTNWDYAPQDITPTQAIAGNNSPLGLVGDVITGLAPYTDDLLIMGCDHSLWAFSGDPMSGGQIDLISDVIGMAWGAAHCKGPDGTLYFLSNGAGVYALMPGQGPPRRISQAIEQLLLDVDTGHNIFQMAWNDRFQGFHLFCTIAEQPSTATHFFYEARTGAWWVDKFASNDLNPTACCTFDGNLPTDRAVLIGGWDGYVRKFDHQATTDDGTPIASSVVIGPLLTSDMDEVLFKDIQAIMGASNAGDVTYTVLTGATAEIALSSTPVSTGTWQAGRNLTDFVRRASHAIWIKLESTTPWAMEAIRCRVQAQGKVRRRGY